MVLAALRALPAGADELLVGAGKKYTTIQAAIDAAQSSDVVAVDPGTYNEAIDFLGKEITVRANGDRASTIIDAVGLAKTSVVSFKTGETANSILEGFTITNGTGTPVSAASSITQGGGIYIASVASPATATTPVIRNCLITKNTASLGGGVLLKNIDVGATIEDCEISENTATNSGGAGGGINIALQGTKANPVAIKTTTIKDNLANNATGAALGGGVYIAGTNMNATITFTSCTITGNVVGTALTPPITSQGDGGGLYLSAVPVVIAGGQISSNTALHGGGLSLTNQGAKSAIGGSKDSYILIQNNTALDAGGGGALYFPSPGATNTSTLKISYAAITGNKAGSQGGGAALVAQGAPNFDSCEFIGNSTNENGGAFRYLSAGANAKINACLFAKNSGNEGGAVYVSSSSGTPTTYQNCVFTGNTAATDGGAVFCKSNAISNITKFLYCTIYKNSAPATTGPVGGIKFSDSAAVGLVLNSILWGNTPADYDSGHILASQIDYCDVEKPTINRSTMFSLDPGFVNPAADPPDLHLMATSLVLALGKVGTDPDLRLVTKDFDGKDRPAITEFQDLGAYAVARTPVEKPKFIRGFCRQQGQNLTNADLDITDPIFLVRWYFSNPGTYVPGCQKSCDADDNGKVEVTDAVYLLNFFFRSPGSAPKAPFPTVGEDQNPDLLPCDDWKTAWPPAPAR